MSNKKIPPENLEDRKGVTADMKGSGRKPQELDNDKKLQWDCF